MEDKKTLVNASSASTYLGVSRGTFYNNVRPYIPYVQLAVCKRRLYRVEDLERFKKSQIVEPVRIAV